MATLRSFANLHGALVTAEEAMQYDEDDDRVAFSTAIELGYCVHREPVGMVVDMDRDRFGNTIAPNESSAVREGWCCP